MTFELTIDDSDLQQFARNSELSIEAARQRIQGVMGEKYFEIVRGNFGAAGVDRPSEWAPLSPQYAKRVNRDHATLFQSGQLESAVRFDNSSPEEAVVSVSRMDCPYALAHQFGNPSKNLPARPYFPMDASGQTTPLTARAVEDAALDAVLEHLK